MPADVFPYGVSRLKAAVAMAMLVLWMPATSLCLLENAGLISKTDNCPADPSSESSPCCALVSAAYKTNEGSAVRISSPVLIIGWFVASPPLVRPRTEVAIAESTESPPGLRQTWQFSLRAALAPRAPSVS